MKGRAWPLVAGGQLGLYSSMEGQPETHIPCQDGPSNLVQCDAGDTCVIISLDEPRNAGQYSIVEGSGIVAVVVVELYWCWCQVVMGDVQGSGLGFFFLSLSLSLLCCLPTCPGALRCGVPGAPLPTEIRLISHEVPEGEDVRLTGGC